MKKLTITFAFTTTVILICASSAKAQSVSAAERQQFATTQTQTSTALASQGVTPRSSTWLPSPNETIQCWRCSSPCGRSYCCADTHPQCCILEDRCRCCPRP